MLKVAAGWNHTVVLTDRFDVYTAGLGNHGQLGHGDEESKKTFTWVKRLGGRKVKDVYAGGAHSWCILDPEEPALRDYAPPSPLRQSPLNSPLPVTPKREGSVDGSLLRERPGKAFLFEGASLQLMFADQQKSHRFARVTLELAKLDAFNRLFLDYIKKIQDEEGGLLLYNIQKDEEVFQDAGVRSAQQAGLLRVNPPPPDSQACFTLMMISEPAQDPRHKKLDTYLQSAGNPGKSSSIGLTFSLADAEVRADPVLRKACFWFTLMVDSFASVIRTAKFWELKPAGPAASDSLRIR